MSDTKDINITVKTGDTVPFHMYDRLQYMNARLSTTISEQKLELEKRQLITTEISHMAMKSGVMPECIQDIIQRINNHG